MRVVPLTDERRARLRPAFDGDEGIICDMIGAGHAAVMETPAGGLVVVRKSFAGGVRELVVMCSAGPGVFAHVDDLREAAAAWGLDEVRMHTKKKSVVRLAGRSGFELAEYVMVLRV